MAHATIAASTAGADRSVARAAAPRDFIVPRGRGLTARLETFLAWLESRADVAAWPRQGKLLDPTNTTCMISGGDNQRGSAINFIAQDYLGLAGHNRIKAAARSAVQRYGLVSGGAAVSGGDTPISRSLQQRIAAFLGAEAAVLFPTGWSAAYGTIRAVARTEDHIVIDQFSSPCLQEAANAATDRVNRFPHLDVACCRQLLQDIRARDDVNGIFVVTESLFAFESDSPDLLAMQTLCHEFGATLLVDVSHDLGCLGDTGRGQLELQNMLGRIDILVGSFAKTFASAGGFAASSNRATAEYLRCMSPTAASSSAPSPIQAAIILAALEMIGSAEGRHQRAAVLRNAVSLRACLREAGFECLGVPSPIVSVVLAGDIAPDRLRAELQDAGLLANVTEFTDARRHTPRLRLLLTAHHCEGNLRDAVARLTTACEYARRASPSTTESSATVLPLLPRAA